MDPDPLADVGLFALTGLAYGAVMSLVRPLRRDRVLLGWLTGSVAFAALTNVEGLHWGACLLLAAGIGSAAARWVGGRRVRFGLVAGVAGVFVALLAAGSIGSRTFAERRAIGVLPPPARAGAPNVLLLVLDTVRAWNLGWHGYGRETPQLLDRRFANATTFGRALSPSPWTLPAHASLFTGHWPSQLSVNWTRPLDDEVPTLAEALGQAGYLTGGFVANYRYAGQATGLARDFAHYDDYPVSWDEAFRMSAVVRRLLRSPRLQEWLGRHRVLEARYAADVNGALLRWLDGQGERPFFAFVNYVDAHSPYLPPGPFDSMFTAGRDPPGAVEPVPGRDRAGVRARAGTRRPRGRVHRRL